VGTRFISEGVEAIIQAAVLTTAVFFIVINTAVDIFCMLLDPRVRQ